MTLILILLQFGVAMIILAHDNDALISAHGGVGYLSTVAAAITAFYAFKWSKETGAKGVFYHALSLPILCLIQIAIIEMHQKWLHVGLGVAYLVAVVGLFFMVRRDRQPAVAA